MKMFINSNENSRVIAENPNIFQNIIKGYKECMPHVDETLLKFRFLENKHILNEEFEKEPKYFIAYDDSSLNNDGIVVISALYVFPEHRNKGNAKELINEMKVLAQNNIVLQVAVNKNKYSSLSDFYRKLEFETTGKPGEADDLNLSYIDLFWCKSNIKLTYTPKGTIVQR